MEARAAFWDNSELGLRLLYNTNPVPETCGRLCPEICTLGHRGDAIAISWLKRYIADRIPFNSLCHSPGRDRVSMKNRNLLGCLAKSACHRAARFV